jgi:hypothetical protein
MRYQFNAMGFDDRVSSGELMMRVISSRPVRDVEELRGFESRPCDTSTDHQTKTWLSATAMS